MQVKQLKWVRLSYTGVCRTIQPWSEMQDDTSSGDGGVLSPHPPDPLLPRRWRAACRKLPTLENVSVSDGERGS